MAAAREARLVLSARDAAALHALAAEIDATRERRALTRPHGGRQGHRRGAPVLTSTAFARLR
jgi:hypothetical protein